MLQDNPPSKRCAIYTRKSTERGLDSNVTSLDAQRDVCRAYIKCQSHRGWQEQPTPYDDGGYSGGTLERPALRRLMADVEAGEVDVIIIYKIDRLTRSLLDFVRLMEVLNRFNVGFVSVTQAFDTVDSMGRLILNILLTFAQFERELMSDRVRDKKAAMQRKGYFTGGLPPFGYLVDSGGRLCVEDVSAAIVRELYSRYTEVPSLRVLVSDLKNRGCLTRRYKSKSGRVRGGQPITTAMVSHILENPVYTGHIVHRGEWIPAQIDPLVTRERWEWVQSEREKRKPKRDPETDYLIGILFDEFGRRMRIQRNGPGQTNPFRYYRSEASGWSRKSEIKTIWVDADQVEASVRSFLLATLRDRKELKSAILADGLYSDSIAKLLKTGSTGARRLEGMNPTLFRRSLLALVPRAEITGDALRLCISIYELKRFLAWDGVGTFVKQSRSAETRIYVASCPAFLVRGHHRQSFPVKRRLSGTEVPNPRLVELVRKAEELRQLVYTRRDESLETLSQEQGMTQRHAARLFRVNYLAPDIIAAIIDGTQPPGLTYFKVLNAAALLDWSRQRECLGLPPPAPF